MDNTLENDIKIDAMQAHDDVTFPPKDVARMLGEDAYTIRFWEKFFGIIITRKEDKGRALYQRRLYTRSNITLFKKIQRLRNDGLTLKNIHYQLVQEGALPAETLAKYAMETTDEGTPSEAALNAPAPESANLPPARISAPVSASAAQNTTFTGTENAGDLTQKVCGELSAVIALLRSPVGGG